MIAISHRRAPVAEAHAELFVCGHPRTFENSYTAPSVKNPVCRLCQRVRSICQAVARDQARINAGEILGRPGHRSRYQYV